MPPRRENASGGMNNQQINQMAQSMANMAA
ncbi:hypothetical protein A2U01_0085969, partial [Trifolium medium]|nr:hypothetical protein [Trifolium medium]